MLHDMNVRHSALAIGLITGAMVLAAVAWRAQTPPPFLMLASAGLAAALAALAVIDLRSFRLPDALTLPLLAAGLGVAWAADLAPLWWRMLSAALGYLLLAGLAAAYLRLRGTPGLGLGDAKLLAAAGAWTGAEGLPTILLIAAATGLACAGAARVLGWDIDRMTRMPFGPFLALGTWVVWLFGPA